MVGQALRVAAVRVHEIDIQVPVAVGFESNLRPVGRPVRICVVPIVARQRPPVTVIGIHNVDWYRAAQCADHQLHALSGGVLWL